MRIQDLRIGNYISPLGIGVTEVEGFSLWDGLIQSTDFAERGIEDFEPIPLTEEWHNKFGVIKNGFDSFEYELPRKNNFNLKVIFNGDYVMIRQSSIGTSPIDDDIISVWNKDLTHRDMYVHEWQNLYFALTSEELISK